MGVAGSIKRRSSDENDSFCSSYGQSHYQDSKKDKEGWIGSDNPGCSHWFYFGCAMLDEMPEPSKFWSCCVVVQGLFLYSCLQVSHSVCVWSAQLYTLQVGSKGLVDCSRFETILRFLGVSKPSSNFLLRKMCRISIGISFAIWCRRNSDCWMDSDLFV